MRTLVFLGGENVAKRDAKTVNAAAFRFAGGTPRVTVFTWAKPSFDSSYLRRRRLAQYFLSLGAAKIDFAGYSDPAESIDEKVNSSDLVYLSGGQISVLLNRFRVSKVDEILRRYRGVIFGRSAGAAVLGKKCLVTNRYSQNLHLVDGLGLVDFSIKPHYEPSEDEQLKMLLKGEPFFAIPYSAALVCREGKLYSIGKVFLFEKAVKSEFLESFWDR